MGGPLEAWLIAVGGDGFKKICQSIGSHVQSERDNALFPNLHRRNQEVL